MIKFRYKRKESAKENIDTNGEHNKIDASIASNGKPPKSVKKDYLECIRAVVVSLIIYFAYVRVCNLFITFAF